MQSQPPHGRTAIGQPVCAHYVGPALGAHTAEDVHPRALRGGVGAFVICARRQGGNEHPAKRVFGPHRDRAGDHKRPGLAQMRHDQMRSSLEGLVARPSVSPWTSVKPRTARSKGPIASGVAPDRSCPSASRNMRCPSRLLGRPFG